MWIGCRNPASIHELIVIVERLEVFCRTNSYNYAQLLNLCCVIYFVGSVHHAMSDAQTKINEQIFRTSWTLTHDMYIHIVISYLVMFLYWLAVFNCCFLYRLREEKGVTVFNQCFSIKCSNNVFFFLIFVRIREWSVESWSPANSSRPASGLGYLQVLN